MKEQLKTPSRNKRKRKIKRQEGSEGTNKQGQAKNKQGKQDQVKKQEGKKYNS